MCRLSMGDQDRAIQPVDNSASEWPVTAVLHVIALAQVHHCIWAYLGRRVSKLSLDQDSRQLSCFRDHTAGAMRLIGSPLRPPGS